MPEKTSRIASLAGVSGMVVGLLGLIVAVLQWNEARSATATNSELSEELSESRSAIESLTQAQVQASASTESLSDMLAAYIERLSNDEVSIEDRDLEDIGAQINTLVETVEAKSLDGLVGYVRVFGGGFRVPNGRAVDLDAPDGQFSSFGLQSIGKGAGMVANVSIDGRSLALAVGDTYEWAQGCKVAFLGAPDDETYGDFRTRCNR